MQQNQKPERKQSLYSKFKQWCEFHAVPVMLFPIIAFCLIAATALIIGGTVAGWDIAGALVSPTAILAYVLLFLGAVYYVYRKFLR